ncbi:MAG: PQQ-binding-like beta-propeller repeat protein, partial [Candidatus Bipolaricaulota bacterium]|nr:PQQ-binding-like beta-propeller repeat protein [Candidatus Bipolaricaulota bacterium]
MLKSRVLSRALLIGLSSLLLLFAAASLAASQAPDRSHPLPQSTPAPGPRLFLPLISRNYFPSVPGAEWTQHAHDAQRTGYTDQVVPTPWRWKWAWNGPNSSGGISSGKFGLPRNSQPVTGGGRVYIAAGSRGVYALNQANGAVVWNRNPGGNINSTPAYDGDTNALFVVSSNGTLYKLNAENGNTVAQFASGASSNLPLPPAVISDRVFFSMGNRVYAVNKATMAQLWSYDAGAPVHTPPAYSPSRNRVIAVSSDLFVHAIENANGARAWRVKPTVRTGGNPGDSNSSVAEVSYGWPVIAEVHGYVLVKLRLDWQALWVWSPWPTDNATIRRNLESRPEYQALLVLDLDDGSKPFIANIGHGGYGDGGYLPMGPQPVVKRLSNGQEVVYIVIRGDSRSGNDGRGDSHPGEMVLDNTTVPGLPAGYVRWIDDRGFTNSSGFFPTDEQPYVSMA